MEGMHGKRVVIVVLNVHLKHFTDYRLTYTNPRQETSSYSFSSANMFVISGFTSDRDIPVHTYFRLKLIIWDMGTFNVQAVIPHIYIS